MITDAAAMTAPSDSGVEVLGAALERALGLDDSAVSRLRLAHADVAFRASDGRGVVLEPEDAYVLGRSELYPLLRGEPITALRRAKIDGRRANFERMLEARLPKYLRDNRPVDFDSGEALDGLWGAGTSRGQVTARARVVSSLKQIGKVKEGEILIPHSTDPSWTPVFTLLSGIVVETGGALAHGSPFARKHGFPAVQLADAANLITRRHHHHQRPSDHRGSRRRREGTPRRNQRWGGCRFRSISLSQRSAIACTQHVADLNV